MLRRRGRTYISRILVPADLQALLGRVEIARSLRTEDSREAARRAGLWETHIGALLATLQRHGRAMTREQLDEIARKYLAATFDEIEGRLACGWSEAALDAHKGNLEDDAEKLSGALSEADYGEGVALARLMLPDAEDETLRRLGRRLMEAKLEAVKAERLALTGRPLVYPAPLREPHPAPKVPPKETPRLSAVAAAYGDERVRLGKWTPKTELQNRTILELLAGLMGDPQIGQVTKAHIRALGEAVSALPANLEKRYPGMTPREAIDRTAGDPAIQRLAPRSVNKYLQMARSLFAWATEHDYITQNPAAILRDVKEPRARDDRKPFTDEDLRAYFAKLAEDSRPFVQWIPRIMAYSGMRLGEAAKLRKEDIRQEREVWVFDVNEEGEGRRLKTEASRRLVPVHSRLIALGLLEVIAGCPEGFLWPEDIRHTANPERGDIDKLSKLLNRRLRAAGVDDPKKTGAHSFRHTVASRLSNASIPQYQIADLLGHEDDSITTGRYGDRTSVERLRDVVESLQLPL